MILARLFFLFMATALPSAASGKGSPAPFGEAARGIPVAPTIGRPFPAPASADQSSAQHSAFAPPVLEPLTVGFAPEEELLTSNPAVAGYVRDWQRASQVPPFSELLATLANAMPSSPSPTLGPWLTDLLFVCGIFFFLVGGMEKAIKFFGPKPPFAEEIASMRKLIALAAPLATVEELKREIIPRTELTGHIARQDTDTRRLSLRVETVVGMVDDAKKEILDAGEKRLARIETRLEAIGDTAAGMKAALEQMNREHHAKK